MDKFLKIGLGLGSCCAIASISYWSTKYTSHLPTFFYPQKPIIKQSARLSNPHYQKIKAKEKEVGCTFHIVFDPSSNGENKVFGLLNEEEINDSLLEKIANRIDSDAKPKIKNGFDIHNLKEQCKWRQGTDKKLRVAAIKKEEGKIDLQVRYNEQGRGNYKYFD